MAPMTRSRADNEGNVPTDYGLYYEQRALLDITRRFLGFADAVGYVNTQEFIQCKLKVGKLQNACTIKAEKYLFSWRW
jgi:2,4-dienoyl-CoA reductase-like NADH-dependent reductase (Old Yellow Enzyme family)